MSIQKKSTVAFIVLSAAVGPCLGLIGCGQVQSPEKADTSLENTFGSTTLYSASSTNPTSTVAIHRMAVTPSLTSARIQFDTKAPVGVIWVYYGTSPSTPQSLLSRTFSTSHAVVLENLIPMTKYYFFVSIRGGPGENDSSTLQSFSTLGQPPAPSGPLPTPIAPAPTPTDPVPTSSGDPTVAISHILIVPSTTGAQINFRTATATSTNWVYYGLGSTTSLSILNRDLTSMHSIMLSNLSPGTKYSYSILVRGGPGISAQTTIGTFTTLQTHQTPTPLPPPAPLPPPIPTPIPPPAPSPVPALPKSCMSANEQATLALINAYRIANGAPPLKVSRSLTNAARWMSQDLAVTDNRGHIDSLGRSPSVRVMAFGFPWGAGENIAGGSCTPESVFAAWKNSAGHNSNMLNPNWVVIGLGYYEGAGTFYCYWTVNLSTPSSPPADLCN